MKFGHHCLMSCRYRGISCTTPCDNNIQRRTTCDDLLPVGTARYKGALIDQLNSYIVSGSYLNPFPRYSTINLYISPIIAIQVHRNLSIALFDIRDTVPVSHPLWRTYLRTSWFSLQRQWSLYIDCSYLYYSITLNNIDISTSGKDKTSASTNGIEAFIKEQLAVEIQRFSTTNAQLMIDKMETEKAKVNLKADKIRLFGKKNSLYNDHCLYNESQGVRRQVCGWV